MDAAMPPHIVDLDTPLDEDTSRPAPERLLAGDPEQRVANYYADDSQQFFAGRWRSTRGAWRVRYAEHEFCHLTAGRVRITSDDGEMREFAAGASFVIPAGFCGTWEVLEDCSKLYVIFERARSDGAPG
jgi:uncharacterized protein